MIQKLMNKKKNKKGFTLIELIVVIAILAILALILVPTITNYIGEANESRDYANARSLFSEAHIEVAMAEDEAAAEAACTAVEAKVTATDGLDTVTCELDDDDFNKIATFSIKATSGKTFELNPDSGQLEKAK